MAASFNNTKEIREDPMSGGPVLDVHGSESARLRDAKHFLGMGRRIRIIMIGAGLSGIGAVKLFKDTFPDRDVDFVIYEKNSDVTGTWLENRYPGCACDVPAHAYTYSWEGNPHWSRPYVGAVELYNYFKGRATAYGIAEFLHLENKVTGASWDDQRGKWIVQVKDLRTGSTFADEGEILINASGFLNSWNWPEIPGLKKFEGKLLHSADWDHNYDFHNKTVVLIGSGSSAVQIVPQLQPIVKHMYSINRSKGWISPHFASQFAPEGPNTIFTKEQQLRWEKDKDGFLAYRREIEAYLNGSFELYHKNSDLQKWASENYRETMCERLGYNEELIKKLVPDEQVGCRRLTPGYGYLEALASNNVAVKTDAIKEITSSGLRMGDGSFLKVDAIICATGFDTSYRPAFPVVAFGRDLRDAWKDEPRSYLSIAAAGIPNYFIMSGPNFSVSNGGLIPCLEANVRYAFAVAKKIQREGIKSLAPKQEAVDDFQQYKDAIMENLVWSGNCVSWYKRNGKVWGPWPGSSLHYLETLSTPRWEDYEISYQRRNRFTYLGNGRTTREKIGKDLAYYVQEPGSKL